MANLVVTGSLTPDATGIYVDQGNGTYLRSGGGEIQQLPVFGYWSLVLGSSVWACGTMLGQYLPQVNASGNATVADAPTANTGRVIAEGIIRQ